MRKLWKLHAADMIERLRTVIESIILPYYPEIKDYEIVSVTNQYGIAYTIGYLVEKDFYVLGYNTKCERLEEETKSLFMMLSPEGIEDMMVVIIPEGDKRWFEYYGR